MPRNSGIIYLLPVLGGRFCAAPIALYTSRLSFYWTMPVDTKRVRGPEVSQSPSLFLCKPAKTLPPDGLRADGRQRDQVDVRPVFVRCGLVSQAKGSAYIEAGNTKLICCVYGPRETERKDETDMKCGRYVVHKLYLAL